jgi:hypothetical protein
MKRSREPDWFAAPFAGCASAARPEWLPLFGGLHGILQRLARAE